MKRARCSRRRGAISTRRWRRRKPTRSRQASTPRWHTSWRHAPCSKPSATPNASFRPAVGSALGGAGPLIAGAILGGILSSALGGGRGGDLGGAIGGALRRRSWRQHRRRPARRRLRRWYQWRRKQDGARGQLRSAVVRWLRHAHAPWRWRALLGRGAVAHEWMQSEVVYVSGL